MRRGRRTYVYARARVLITHNFYLWSPVHVRLTDVIVLISDDFIGRNTSNDNYVLKPFRPLFVASTESLIELSDA